MSTVEKSMEKTKFYNREDLKAKDVVRLIGIWDDVLEDEPTNVSIKNIDHVDFIQEVPI